MTNEIVPRPMPRPFWKRMRSSSGLPRFLFATLALWGGNAFAQAPFQHGALGTPAVPRVAATGGAAAEQAPASANVVAAPGTPPAAPLPPDLQAQIDEMDQRSRISERKLELLQEELTKKANESAVLAADEKGFFLRSFDKRTFVQVRGLLQLDTRWFFGNSTVTNNTAFNDSDSFLVRRFRPEFAGTLVGLADFLFSPDFAGASATIFDAYVDVHPFPWLRLRVGKQKTPLGLERLQSEGAYPFMERSLSQNLTPGRDIGAALWGEIAGGILTYNVGVWNGFPDNANNSGGASPDGDTNHAKDFIGRLLVQPFKALPGNGSLGIGFAASTGNRKGRPGTPLLPTYRSAGQLPIFGYAVGPTSDTSGAQTTFAHLRETHLNPQFYYYNGPYGLLAEYVWAKQGVQRGNNTTDLTNQAYHVSASYVIGGTASYDGAAPTNPFDPAKGNFGALEIAARHDALHIDDKTFDRSNPAAGSYARGFAVPTAAVSKAQGWTGALVYSPSRTLRFYLNYEQTVFTDGAAAVNTTTGLATNRKTENLLFGRVHVKF